VESGQPKFPATRQLSNLVLTAEALGLDKKNMRRKTVYTIKITPNV